MRKIPYAFFVFCFFVPFAQVFGAEEPRVGKSVTWTTDDGVQMAGLYKLPTGPGRPIWILLHGLGSSKQEWLGFVRLLTLRGDGFLIYDARGHGESVHQSDDTRLDYREFRADGPGSSWDRMAGDLDSAVRLLKSRFSTPPRRIAVGGASLGANVALTYASRHREVPAAVLLSPGLEYAGVQTEGPFRQYGDRPIFFAASPGDAYAHASMRKLALQCPASRCTLLQGEGAAHGVAMFNEAFTRTLLDWMSQIK